MKKKEQFELLIFRLSASMYMFYFIFSMLPSMGPQYHFNFPENSLPEAYVFDHIMHFIQNTAEQPTGAFPSSHVGIAIIIVLLSRKHLPRFYRIALFVSPFIMFSTVYIKAHYAIDVIGGIVIAPFLFYLSTKLDAPQKKYQLNSSIP